MKNDAKMVWAFYHQEDYVKRCYKNYRLGWGEMLHPINLDRLQKYNI